MTPEQFILSSHLAVAHHPGEVVGLGAGGDELEKRRMEADDHRVEARYPEVAVHV